MANEASLDDPFLPLAFSLFSNPGAYAVLAGAGVSRGAGLPTAWDIVVDLIGQMAGDGPVEINSDTAAPWYEERFDQTPTYSDVVEKLALTPTERQGLLRKYFEPSDADGDTPLGPSVAHRAIARMMQAGVIRVVLTMNFDRLFEQALRELQIEPTIVATEADAQGLGPLHTVQHCIIHLHGDYLNARSMRNTAAELSGYARHTKALLRHVLTEYGLLVAGWSVEHDHALRDAVAAHHPSLFTMGWVSPGPLTQAAGALTANKKALVLETTADDAFGHLADQVESMRERRARHPLTLAAAVSRIKRELSGQRPAIGAHDMLAAEFARLRSQPAFHRDRFMDGSSYQPLLEQVVEASRIPAGCVAALAYWGTEDTDRWWLPEIARFARPFVRSSGSTALLNLPLVAATMPFYAAGSAAVAAERFDLVARLFALRGHKVGSTPESLAAVLVPSGLADQPLTSLYGLLADLVGDAIGLGSQPTDEGIQTFEILRLCSEVIGEERFSESVKEYALRDSEFEAAAELDVQTWQAAWIERDRLPGRVAESCYPYYSHIFAAERTYEADGPQRWRSPVAERISDEVARLGNEHPLATAWRIDSAAFWLALQGVSVAVGRAGSRLERGYSGFIPDEFWLDTGQPPGQQ
jgi:SIR2-like domain